MTNVEVTDDGNIIINVPMSLRTFSGRKRIITPEDKERDEIKNEAVLTALARANHWQEMLDNGHCESAQEIAKKLKIDQSYVQRILRLNQLSPRIVRLILAGEAPNSLSLSKLNQKLPVLWVEQEQMLLD